MYERIEPYLAGVRKPARYTGGEWGAVAKDKSAVVLRVAFCFPDTYEIGMSCLGLRVMYDVMNRLPDVWCERAFAPWEDMRALHERKKIPLYALESGDALEEFDALAFTLQYELCYTNVLDMLHLSGIPLRSSERDGTHPLVIAGGPCAYNPEPMSDFIDLFVIGEGEEVTPELLALLLAAKKDNAPRRETLRRAARIQGVYVPSLYDVSYNQDGTISAVTPRDGAPDTVVKRVVKDLDAAPYPTRPLVPNTEIVHDRVMLELFRGCTRGCRFCQAGYVTRPVRGRSPEVLCAQAKEAAEFSGNEEIGLVSLSTSDYPPLEGLCDSLLEWAAPRRVSLSLPSLRADSFSRGLMEKVQSVRKSGLTFAPEAGTARLRDVINKNLSEDDLMAAVISAFEGGWGGVKLYFMIGLPTETDEDALGIASLAGRVYSGWRAVTPDRSRGVRVTASASCFVPKPHTPFQWEPMDSPAELERKAGLIKGAMRKQVTFHWHEPDTSYLEGVLARGDRRLCAAVEEAWRSGCRMDGWSEGFSLAKWKTAFERTGIDPDFYALRRRSFDEVLPWAHISCGVSAGHLRRECENAYAAAPTPDCRSACAGCGVTGCGLRGGDGEGCAAYGA